MGSISIGNVRVCSHGATSGGRRDRLSHRSSVLSTRNDFRHFVRKTGRTAIVINADVKVGTTERLWSPGIRRESLARNSRTRRALSPAEYVRR